MSKLEYRAMQELKYRSGQIDRRTFVRSLLATGVALPSALSLAGQVAASTPKSGGRFRMGLGHGSTTDTLDSATSENHFTLVNGCLLYTSPSPRDATLSRMPSSA